MSAAPRDDGEHALTRSRPPAPRSITDRLPAVVQRALPTVARSAAGLAAGLVADYAMRSLTRRAAGVLTAPLRRAVQPATPPATPPAPVFERHTVTEVLIVERSGRR